MNAIIKPMTIRAIFFDLGNVLLSLEWSQADRALQQHCNLTSKEIGDRFMVCRFKEFELGVLSPDEFFSEVKHSIGFPGQTDQLAHICSDMFVPIQAHIDIARALKNRYKLAILSNTNKTHIDFIQNRFEILDIFDAHIYSHRVHARKPDPRIYGAALETLQVNAEESLFIDDLEQNVEGARKLGWNTIHLKKDQPDFSLERALEDEGVIVH